MNIVASAFDTPLIDGHAHLDRIDDVGHVLETARRAGVMRVIGVGMDLLSNQKIMALADRFPQSVRPAIGYHPWEIREHEVDATLDMIQNNLARCIALGEVGLDYKVKVKKPLQQGVFAALLELAEKKHKPVIVHSRFSHQRCYRMVSSAGIEKAVFHWYSGPLDILDRILSDGYRVSATPALAYSKPHKAAMRRAPLAQILIETDTPVAYQGRVSEPVHLLHTLKELSRIKGLSLDEVAEITTQNTVTFYGM